MSKRSSRRTSNQPIVPQVSAETWKALVAEADAFNELAPWEWMHDSHVIGMRHPVTKEVLYGSILGRLRQVYGLLVYRNDAGRRWLLNTILNEGYSGGFDTEDTAFEQDLVKAEFVLKRELVKEDRSVLAAAGFSSEKRRGCVWPQFRSLVPGGYPWHVTQDEGELLLFALPRAAAVARLMLEHPHMWDDHCDGEIGFVPVDFDPATDALRPKQMEWQPMVAPPEQSPEAVSLDPAAVQKLRELPKAEGFHLELDVTYAPFPIAEKERPYFPRLAMAVDRALGFVGGFRLGDLKDQDGATALGTVLLNSLTQLKHRPESIRVQRPRVAAMLAAVSKELGTALVQDAELAELNFARQSMEQHFNRGR